MFRGKSRRTIIGILALALAALVLLPSVVRAIPWPRSTSLVSVHPVSTLAPVMGLPEDSLLNTGTLKELDQLPGIGEVIGSRIIEMRDQLGGFLLPEQLLYVKGIGEKRFADIMDYLDEPLVTITDLPE